ncbi:MAG: hypothetical protein WKG01_09235 [Kofleriaceae bacterium]
MQRFMKDIAAAKARVLADIQEVQAAGIEALPTMFIGNRKFTGARMTTEELIAEIERAPR